MRSEDAIKADAIAIRNVAEEFLAAYNAANLERVCLLLTEGAVLMPADEPAIAGKEQVRGRMECFFSDFSFTMRFTPKHTELMGDIAFERGTYSAFAVLKHQDCEPRGGYGEYLLLFERQPLERNAGGLWRIAAFGTAAAQGVPPQSIAAPERLLSMVEGTFDPETLYWREKWVDTLSEHLPYPVLSDIRKRLDGRPRHG